MAPKILLSFLIGAPLWWLVIIFIMTTVGEMGMPQDPSLIPGYLYVYAIGGMYFTEKFGLMGYPLCVLFVFGVLLLAGHFRARSRRRTPAPPR